MTRTDPLTVGDTVYLTPKTRGAARECWSQPRAVILSIDDPFVTVRLLVPTATGRPRSVIPPTPTVVYPAAAAWIREHVLTKHHRQGGRALIDACPCQWGPCGYCLDGKHLRCAHRRPGYSPVSPETYLTNRAGYVRADVWRATGPACTWHCPCPAPECAATDTDGPTVTTHAANVVRTLPRPAGRRRPRPAPPAATDPEALTLW